MVYATENSRDRGFQLDPADIEGLFEVQGTGWSGDVPKHTKGKGTKKNSFKRHPVDSREDGFYWARTVDNAHED